MAAFDEQSAGGKLVCPLCDSRRVTKAPMAPAIGASAVLHSADDPSFRSLPAIPQARELRNMRQFMTGLRKYVERNAEYVGAKFPEEARKIHYGESEHKHIYGEASLKDAADLVDEGIDVAPLPPDVDDLS